MTIWEKHEISNKYIQRIADVYSSMGEDLFVQWQNGSAFDILYPVCHSKAMESRIIIAASPGMKIKFLEKYIYCKSTGGKE